jgi:transposase InsO family protein
MSVDELWSRQHIIDAQAGDSQIATLIPVIESGSVPTEVANSPDKDVQCYLKQRQSLIVRNGILYRAFSNIDGTVKHYQLVLPKQLREPLLKTVHEVSLCHLKSQLKVEAQVARHAFWPTWKTDIRIFLSKCRVCAEYHTGKLPKNGYLRPNDGSLGSPGTRLSIDLIGPLPISHGFKYAITICDMFSRYLQIQPLRDKTATSVATALLKFFLVHGWYAIIKSDWGSEFQNAVSQQLYQMAGIQRHTSFSYLPRENLIERSHRVVNAMIGKTANSHRSWTEYIDCINFAYNSSIFHKGTNYAPNYLHFGRSIPNSLDILMANPEVEVEQNYGEFAEKTAERMQFAFNLAREAGLQLAAASKRYYDARVRPKLFEAGDTVLAFCPQRRKNVFSKWARPFSAEAEIVRRLNDVTYIIKFKRTRKSCIIHVDKLKLLQRRGTAESGNDANVTAAN